MNLNANVICQQGHNNVAHIPKKERKSEKGLFSVNVCHVEAEVIMKLDMHSFQFITLYAQPNADLINERETHSFRTLCTIERLSSSTREKLPVARN